MRHCIYRPYQRGRIPAPLQVRSTGYSMVPAGWNNHPAEVKEILELFWCASGAGKFVTPSGELLLKTGQCCWYFPGDLHDISAGPDGFKYYHLALDGPAILFLIGSFDLKREPKEAGKCPEALFAALECAVRDMGISGEYRASAIAYDVLVRAAMPAAEPENRTAAAFREIVEEQFSDPALTVDSIAEQLKIHRSTLRRLIRNTCGIPPKEYLMSCRLQCALDLLQSGNCTIKEIARDSGFDNQNYFAKAFRKRFGQPPSAYLSGI